MQTQTIDIGNRKMVDTKRIVFELSGAKGAVRITSWTEFEMEVYSVNATTGAHTSVATRPGSLETNGIDGRVYFVPTGTIPRGEYFYDARGRDTNGELGTFATGTYNVV